MNFFGKLLKVEEYYRGNELSPGVVEPPGTMEPPVAPQVHSAIEGKNGEKDAAAKEREERLELWMEDIKAFIRKIDTGSL